MRFGVAVLFLIVACSCPETPKEAVPDVPSVLSAASSPSVSSGGSGFIDRTPDSPRTTEPPQRSADAVTPYLLDPLAASCPIPASTCPDTCVAVTGARFDEAKQCFPSTLVVGCLHPNSQLNSDLTCLKRHDGVVLAGSSSLRSKLGPDWGFCNREETDAVLNGAACR